MWFIHCLQAGHNSEEDSPLDPINTCSESFLEEILYELKEKSIQVLTLISDREITQVWEGVENTVGKSLDVLYKLQKSCDQCVDHNAASVILMTEPIMQAYVDLKRRGIRVRFITEITQENIEYCREIMKIADVRHLDGISGNFTIADRTDYAGVATTEEAQPITQLLVSNVRAFVQQQEYFFEMLWRKAISSEDRIRELEEGVAPEFIEVISDKNQVVKHLLKLVREAKKEVMVVLPNTNAVERVDKMGLWHELIAASKNGIKISVICPFADSSNNAAAAAIINNLQQESIVEFIAGEETQSGIVIVDSTRFIAAELVNPLSDTFQGAIGMSLYSNNNRIASLLSSFFESLWKEAELFTQLEQANEKLQMHDMLQREFINIAAHELRTPTQAILGYAELTQMPDSNLNKDEALSKIMKNAKRLQSLTEDILDVTRIESQTLKLNKTRFDLRDTAANVLDDYRNTVQAGKDLEYLLLDADKPVFVLADKERISQVLSNLVSNALKFTKSGIISASIEEEFRTDEEDKEKKEKKKELIVSVKDTGTGIDSDIMPHLFTKFVSKSPVGTGLGLFISKSIVQAHGGRIWAENNPDGKGATFRFSLPIE
jgi:signal transduction histidine kinase